MSLDTTTNPDIVLDPSGIGEAVKQGLSPWYIKIRFQDDSVLSDRNWKEANTPLSALPAQTGNKFEANVYDQFTPHATEVIDSWRDYEYQEENNQTIRDIVTGIASQDADADPTMLLQTQLAGDIEGFYVAGDADLIVIWPGDPIKIRIFDIKSSWEERTYHQVQVAVYSILFDRVLSDTSLDSAYEIDGGIIYRETDYESIVPDDLPQFPVGPREDDIHRLLSDDGPFQRAFDTPFDALPLPVDGGQSSSYAEVYNTKAIESSDISLLGLTGGEQRILRQNGLTTLEDVAELVEPPESPKPYRFEDPDVRRDHRDLVRTLEEKRGLSTRIPVLAQRAQALLGELNPEHPDAHDKPWTPWIQGAGSAALPEDDPSWGDDDLPFDAGSLIRVYVNVQYDYIRDQVAVLSARLDCTNYDGAPLSFSHAIDDIPADYADRTPEEGLLTTFADDLFGAIDALSTLSNQGSHAPVHFYLYTEQERTALVDAATRHSDTQSVHAVRDMFGMREGIDQAMVSVVQPEIDQRLALKQPSTGLFQMTNAIYPNDDEDAKLSFEDFEYERDDGTEVNLRDAFNYQLFDDARPYVREEGTIRFLTGRSDEDPDGFYPVLPRQDAQFPLEYLWACEELDKFGPDWTDEPRHKPLIERYQWVDSDEQDTRLVREDIEALGERAAHALHHLERSLSYRDADIEKDTLNIDVLDSFTLGDGSLSRAVREYLDLEHRSTVNDALSQYRQPVKQRILSGRSVPVRITDVEDAGYMMRAEGELIYDAFTFDDPDQIAKSSRAGGAGGGSSGSWKVATSLNLTPTGYTDDASNPDQLMHSRPVTIDEFDPDEGTVVLTSYRRSDDYKMRYATWSKDWSMSETDGSEQYFGPGEEFILDDPTDDRNANKALVALDYADQNPVYNLMTDFLHGHRTEAAHSPDVFDDIDEYMSWVKTNCEFEPNTRQNEFITQTDHQIGLLQGPPGTGKTSGALAHALLGRAYSSAMNGKPLRAAVTGASNKSVDEVLDDVAEMLADHDEDSPLGDTMLVRLVLDEPEEPDHDNVAYVNYNDTEHPLMPVLEQRLEDTTGGHQSGIGDFADDDSPPRNIIVFGTPSRLQKLTAKFDRTVGIEERYSSGERFFDVLAADEASMLPLWQLFMVGAFWDEDGQVLLAGDQRQMPPVQSHEWADEDRRIIEEFVPYLSALNYFRFLRGEDVQRISDRDIESPDVTVPMTRLEQTYRCHEDVSEFLSEWVYAQDGIDYTSEETDTIASPGDNLPDGIGAALDPSEPISLLLHDDKTSHQSNYPEACLIRMLIDRLPESEDIGVVVPHNAQKGLISTMCGDDAEVDTVERFQGGQKDVIILSATVSDPDFLQQESDFILNPNRLNVALSRMKKKLIVVAPKTLFRLLPQEIDEYNDSIIWKGLYSHVDASAGARWSGGLREFADLDHDLPIPSVDVDVCDQTDDTE